MSIVIQSFQGDRSSIIFEEGFHYLEFWERLGGYNPSLQVSIQESSVPHPRFFKCTFDAHMFQVTRFCYFLVTLARFLKSKRRQLMLILTHEQYCLWIIGQLYLYGLGPKFTELSKFLPFKHHGYANIG